MDFLRSAVAAAVFVAAIYGTGFASMQNRVDELVRSRNYNTGGLGVVVMDLDRDSVVVSINANVLMNPASVQKLITGAAALEILGPMHTHLTNVYHDGTWDPDSGVINGNLYIRGGGDPGLNAERIWVLVQHLLHRGVRQVTGNLVIDNNFFDNVGLGPGFDNKHDSRSYMSLISALSPNYSSVAIHHRPGGEIGGPVHIDIFPSIPSFKVNSTAITVEGGDGRLDISTALKNGVTTIDIKGTMGIDERPVYTYRRMWNTWDAFGGAFREQCRINGLRIAGRTVQGRVPDSLIAQGAFYAFGGEPLTEFIKHMFKWSSNFVSEMLFKTMGARRRGEPGTWPKGTEAIEEWWESRGFSNEPRPLFVNGSGMGSLRPQRVENLVTAGQTVELLAHVSKQKRYFPEFVASLPSAGVDGTLRARFRRSELRGLVRGKTGTLNSMKVSALAGYMLLENKTYAFAIFCNNVGSGQHDNWIMQEQILEIVAGVRGN